MCCTDYVACVFAGVWSIVQTVFHLSWCIWGVYLYQCAYELDSSTFKYFWYLTYFYTNSCINATLDNLFSSSKFIIVLTKYEDHLSSGLNETYDIFGNDFDTDVWNARKAAVNFPRQSAAAGRTHSIFQTFIIIDALWIIAAIALLVGTCFRIRLTIASFFYFPWTVILLFILFFDGVAAVWYGIDISYTYGMRNWFFFIGGYNQTALDEYEAKWPKNVSTQPSVMMMVLFSRFFVVWFVNLFLFFRVLQAAVNAVENFDDEESLESKQNKQGESGNVNVVTNPRPHHFQVRDVNPDTASVRIRRWQLYYGTDDDDEEEAAEQRVRQHPRRNSKLKGDKRSSAGGRKEGGQNLAVIGGYEGDRSTSPSPLSGYGRQIRNPLNSLYSSGHEVKNDMYIPYEESRSICSDYADIDELRNLRVGATAGTSTFKNNNVKRVNVY